MKRIRLIARRWVIIGFLCFSLMTATFAFATDLGDLIAIIGGGAIIKTIAGPINDFINTITFNKGVRLTTATKVVPIVSIGQGTFIGAAQVSGPRNAIARTKAVAQIEAVYQGKIRIKILVPIDSENPLERFRRVHGVGVSAIIDVRL